MPTMIAAPPMPNPSHRPQRRSAFQQDAIAAAKSTVARIEKPNGTHSKGWAKRLMECAK